MHLHSGASSFRLMAFVLRNLLLALSAALCAAATQAATVILEAPEPLRELLQKHAVFMRENVTTDFIDNTSNVQRIEQISRARLARREIPDLLATEGYFAPKIDIDTRSKPMRVKIDPGPPTRIADIEIQFLGEIQEQSQYADRLKELRDSWQLHQGWRFRQVTWSRAKNTLLARLRDQDFAAARLVSSSAYVDAEHAQAHLKLVYDSGPAFTLGETHIEGLYSYDDKLLDRYVNLKPGEAYSSARLLEIQTALQNTPYFTSVDVDIDRDPKHPNNSPVYIRLSEAKSQRLTFGIGYSSNTGARTEMQYRNINLWDRAWQFSSGIRLEQHRQSAYADIFLPPSKPGIKVGFGSLLEYSDIAGLKLKEQSIGAVRSKTHNNIETRINLNLQREVEKTESLPANSKFALTANYTWIIRRVDNLLDPREGWTLQLELGGASKFLFSDENFIRSYGRSQIYFSFTPRDVIMLRGEGGYTAAKSRKDVPQNFLFRTGGAQSVRGYSYLGLGVQQDGATLGGRYMAVGSIEYTHWLRGKRQNFGAATFFDIGNAGDSLEDFTFHKGYGVGLRWRSPAGPLAFDLGYAPAEHKVRPHVSIAIAF